MSRSSVRSEMNTLSILRKQLTDARAEMSAFQTFVRDEKMRLDTESVFKLRAVRRLRQRVMVEEHVRPLFVDHPEVRIELNEDGIIVLSALSTNVVMSLSIDGLDWLPCLSVQCRLGDGRDDNGLKGFVPLTHVQVFGDFPESQLNDRLRYAQWPNRRTAKDASIIAFLRAVNDGLQVVASN